MTEKTASDAPVWHNAEQASAWADGYNAALAAVPAQDVAEIQNVGNTGPISDDIRWAVNVLLEKIAAKFEANDTLDIWRSDAAATVRSFKHDLSASQPPAGPTQGVDGRAAIIKREFDEYFQLAEARIAQQGRMLTVVRKALRPFAEIALAQDTDPNEPDMINGVDLAITPTHIRAARVALEDRGSQSPAEARKESEANFLHRQDQLEAQGAIEALELENARLRRAASRSPAATSAAMNYLVNGGNEAALLKAQLEHMGGALERELEEVQRLTGLVEGVRAKTIEECARAVDDHLQPGHGCVSQAAAVVLKLLHPSTERTTTASLAASTPAQRPPE